MTVVSFGFIGKETRMKERAGGVYRHLIRHTSSDLSRVCIISSAAPFAGNGGDLLAVNQGTLYPVLLRLEQEGAIASEWGASANNRRARFYRLTRAGRKQLQAETQDWEQTAEMISRFFTVKAEDLI
jgi:hypothetical protein